MRVDAKRAAPTAAVRGVLAAMANRIPEGERRHVASHLPADVQDLFQAPRRTRRAAPARTVAELVAEIVVAADDLPPEGATPIVTGIVVRSRRLVPEDADDVAAVLPPERRVLWTDDAEIRA